MKRLAVFLPILAIVAIVVACAEANDPVAPGNVLVIEAEHTFMGDPLDMDVTSGYIYVAEDQAGFSIWDRATLQQMSQNWEFEEDFNDVEQVSAVDEYDRLFIYNQKPSGSDGIYIFDVTDPAAPVWVAQAIGNTQNVEELYVKVNDGEYDVPESASSQIVCLRTIDNELYYGYYQASDGIDMWHGSPEELITTFPLDVGSFTEDYQYLYVTQGQLGFYIVDKATHEVISTCDTPGEALQIAVNGDVAYVADRHEGLVVIDISDRNNPVQLDTGYDTSGYAQYIDVEGNWLAVGSGGGGVYLFNITDPADPVFVDRLSSTDVGYVRCVDLYDGHLYVASRDNGILDITIHP